MKKIIFIMISVVIGILVYQKNDEIIIPSDAIRVRIIANSNSIKDLYEKQRLKEDIKEDLYNFISSSKSSMEADNIISNNLDNIFDIVSKKTNDFDIDYGLNYFPEKIYKGVLYPEGEYKSLVITLGSGLGDNWWCVLYPPICMIDDNETTGDIEYRSLVFDMLTN